MKKFLALFLALALSLSLLVGCGSSYNQQGTVSGTANESTGTASSDQSTASGTSSESADIAWPENDINLVLGYGAGGDSDVSTRYMAEALRGVLDVNVVVTNMGGANGSLAAEEIMNSNDPEYNFLVINTASISANVATGLTDYKYDALDAISIFSSYSGEVLYVAADAPYNTIEEFIDYAKTNKVIMGVSMGGALYAAASAMKAAGLQLDIVDAGDGVDRMPALMAGSIDCTFASYSSGRDYIENGDFKELATLCADRISAAPDLPCVCEYLDGVIVNTKFVVLAKKGTDPAILQKFNDALQTIYETNAEYVKNVEDYSFQSAKPMTIEETLKELEVQYETFQNYKQFLS